jgi:DhnA family fructose-bisphosphate aldolase class Ia
VNDTPLRLRRIVHPATGRAVLLSFTSGLDIGVTPGMADLAATVAALASTGHLTGAIVHAGVEDSLFGRFPNLRCGTVVDLFGGTWMTTHPERREQICSVEQAVRVGADAALMTVSLGSSDESRQLRLCGQVARECRQWGLPLVARIDTTETDAKRQFSPGLSGHGARLAYELGADLVVVNYPGRPDAFAEALKGIDIPVLLGGAPNLASDEGLLDSVRQGIAAGARGVALNASMFWNGGPSGTLQEMAEVVFGSLSPP